jgi:hypothetical protein
MGFAQQPLCPISGDRAADLATGNDRPTIPRTRHCQVYQDHERLADGGAGIIESREVRFATQGLGTQRILHSDRQPASTFRASPAQHLPSVCGAHPLAESMDLLSPTIVGLVGSLHLVLEQAVAAIDTR